jgi:phosphonopyruvate decarboxylase
VDSIEAVRLLHGRLRDEAVVASLGTPAFLLYAAGDRPLNFYMWAAMGMASSVGLGLAVARPDRRVVVLDGDGAALMNLGGMVTVGWRAPRNLVWMVLENGVFLETGRQRIATAERADLVALARGAGLPNAAAADNGAALGALLDRALSEDGPTLVVARVSPDDPPGPRPTPDAVRIKHRFMDHLGATSSPG